MVKMENNLSFEQTSWELDAWLLQAREAYARLPPEAWDNEEDGFGSSWARDRYEADGYR